MTVPDAAGRFTALYDELYPRVYAYAVSRAGRMLAEEVTSETFCVVWRRFRDLPDPPLPWVLGIARNMVRKSHRTQARQESLAAEMRHWTSSEEPDVGEAVEERTSIVRGLAAISDADRELLTLVAWHGLSTEEAAKVIGCSKAAYFVRLHRARKRLERAIGESAPAVRRQVTAYRPETTR